MDTTTGAAAGAVPGLLEQWWNTAGPNGPDWLIMMPNLEEYKLRLVEPEHGREDFETIAIKLEMVEAAKVYEEFIAWRRNFNFKTDENARFKVDCYLADIQARIRKVVIEHARFQAEMEMAEAIRYSPDMSKRARGLAVLGIQGTTVQDENHKCEAYSSECWKNKARCTGKKDAMMKVHDMLLNLLLQAHERVAYRHFEDIFEKVY
jgi:hypothetical protein